MLRVLIISAEPRLVQILKDVVGQAQFTEDDRWSKGQQTLIQDTFDVVLVDHECVKAEQLDTLIGLDSVFKEVVSVFLVRYQDERTKALRQALASLDEMIDMSQGKAGFIAELKAVVDKVKNERKGQSAEDRAEAAQREARRERDRLDESEKKKTKAYRATQDSAALERELHHMWMQMKRLESKYEVFGLWKGCGRKVLQERFYVMVKEHHPDVYGGNVSDRVKGTAQDIFIFIKDSYQELLKAEKGEQTVAGPKTDVSSNPFLKRATTQTQALSAGSAPTTAPTTATKVNPVAAKPAAQTPNRTTKSTPVIAVDRSAPPAADQTGLGESSEAREEVKARIERLSGFRKRQEQRRRRQSRVGMDMESSNGFDELSESSFTSEASEASEPEVDPEAERRQKLLALQRKASQVNHPNLSNPAKEAFNDGYRAYKAEHFNEAFKHFEQAYTLVPDDGMYQTYYGYMLFRQFPERHAEAEELLKKAMNSGHKQAAPDALLFMGHLLKAQGELDKAHRHYEKALKLNPACTEAERELRLAKIRNERKSSDPGSFIKNLFKK